MFVEHFQSIQAIIGQPRFCFWDVITRQLFCAVSLLTFFAYQVFGNDFEPLSSVLVAQIEQLRVIIFTSRGTAQGKEGGVFQLQDGHNGLVEQVGINMCRLIQQNDISARSTSRLKKRINIVL